MSASGPSGPLVYLYIQKMFIEKQSRLYMLNYPWIIEIFGDILRYYPVYNKIESWDDN